MIQTVMERIVDADDSRGGHRQSERRLESVHERGQAGRGRRLDEAASRRPRSSRTRGAGLALRADPDDVPRRPRSVDPYSPTAPTLIARRFDEDREIPEARVQAMLEEVLSSPLVPRVAKLIEKRLGRPLEPFDIWYNGFRPRGAYTEAELDEIVRKRYPTAEAYKRDMPNLLRKLGFSKERAEYLAEATSRSIRRAAPATRSARGARGDKPHLRTRVGKDGMDYKGYNIAVHEMGHNVEQMFSLNDIDHYSLSGVPNTAFTEALAFVFQAKDLELLGLASPTRRAQALQTLNDFWGTYEIAGVALVDMAMWHWMYDHPDATPAAAARCDGADLEGRLEQATTRPSSARRDVVLLGVYAHMVDNVLYLPDYPIGHLIAFQIEEQMEKAGNIGPEFERMSKTGQRDARPLDEERDRSAGRSGSAARGRGASSSRSKAGA